MLNHLPVVNRERQREEGEQVRARANLKRRLAYVDRLVMEMSGCSMQALPDTMSTGARNQERQICC